MRLKIQTKKNKKLAVEVEMFSKMTYLGRVAVY